MSLIENTTTTKFSVHIISLFYEIDDFFYVQILPTIL